MIGVANVSATEAVMEVAVVAAAAEVVVVAAAAGGVAEEEEEVEEEVEEEEEAGVVANLTFSRLIAMPSFPKRLVFCLDDEADGIVPGAALVSLHGSR
ncbi:hypothetical protein BSKO_09501 [Bryopsis sp. KO-2023]|nr:hypothetical protein BSKO_09501 [Bryopsis sp. KO-2023]